MTAVAGCPCGAPPGVRCRTPLCRSPSAVGNVVAGMFAPKLVEAVKLEEPCICGAAPGITCKTPRCLAAPTTESVVVRVAAYHRLVHAVHRLPAAKREAAFDAGGEAAAIAEVTAALEAWRAA